VHVPVDLDHQHRLGTIEVGDEAPDRMLTPDLETDLPVAHFLPNLRLGRRQRMTKVARALQDPRGDEVTFGFGHATPFPDSPSPQPFATHPRGDRGGFLRERELLTPLPAGEG
jgi:hypothetical protein